MALIEMKKITKTFGSTKALTEVDFELRKGEILSLLGENGAGKTTLMKILYGMYHQDSGDIYIDERKTSMANPNVAIENGICMVHQHFMLVPAFTVAENIVAGYEPSMGIFFDRKRAYKEVTELIKKFNFNLDPGTKVRNLSVGEQQRIEILKALYRKARILILDEPTAVLTPLEVDQLFVTLRSLRAEGNSIIIITHKLYETMNLADRVAVLRDGHMIRNDIKPEDTNVVELSSFMVGRPIKLDITHPAKNIGEPFFCVNNLNVTENGVKKLDNVNFHIKKGEIYGFAGIEGNGQTQLLAAVTGCLKADTLEVRLGGETVCGSARTFLDKGIGHVPEDRSTMGLVAKMSVKENMILGYHGDPDISTHGVLNRKYIEKYADSGITDFQVKTPDREAPVRSLSGGNQQKVVMARALKRKLKVLVVAHPTRGVDIGSSEYIHEQIRRFRDSGKAVLLVSADLDETCALSDRLAVIYAGKIVTECKPGEYSKVEIGLLMTGNSLESIQEARKNAQK